MRFFGLSLLLLVSCTSPTGMLSKDSPSLSLQVAEKKRDAIKSLTAVDLFEDGVLMLDELRYHLDFASGMLTQIRSFDPIPASAFGPLKVQQSLLLSSQQVQILQQEIKALPLRYVTRCKAELTPRGSYGGRFFVLEDQSEAIVRIGFLDENCASNEIDCEGICTQRLEMERLFTLLQDLMPILAKPETIFRCSPRSPDPCGEGTESSLRVLGDWSEHKLRYDLVKRLATKLCQQDVARVEGIAEDSWRILNGQGLEVGSIRVDGKLQVFCFQ